ncbi:5-(carboxyamino)imidazole ribonucleotide synthase [Candidatus Roizmanbacteria bacterium RIFCSPLOWO2_12_FULL_40_12]|uniref:N5-carboxyaminoimidazole ribonucleotide synthase n=1 Tax=Candidatus Roizmanbacteria bacterium RIFCSPLOWO2_01_FULL_40_42 TaxID=1802066 RepID=A0A1F7J6Q4_9BACT|nr:MAG: 5-(carboxyamino)imidazole ribonucleotide synthase [Candidatus Roizmanbacteria bacterium RIFCSPHIGHO2_01_FULL_40_98]OGK27190.1 MAG: 5-(carboxyamino)imidazole ribonucleotide synthase [Candidatus Roizmanbacteria bacterium RIFCSPHIGHO2_02_FULL_40_53]OGK30063.1 MAG: 5-(carboxyamino)imidazole ribonucleotide synthase [Candidatus Roizmanbacteria bacterium RIFCSPHIGHO2_12_41_18]OGK36063.1 MAG: 5-(carboxyamino)imidazole ribonucleotide synthase [Candidatus Roizmanbacteria bacterium RIFCSPHIGHO2_12_
MKNRIGIVGGGQLGRMMAFSAKQLGFTVHVVDPTAQSPAGQVVDSQIVADYKDQKAIKNLAKKSDFLTFEVELANADILNRLTKQGIKVNPSAKTLGIIKDKFAQKAFLRKHRISVADFAIVENKKEIEKYAKKYGYPFLLKARFDAYDGRGNFLVKNQNDISKGIEKLKERKLYIEKNIPFVKELSIIVVRSINGNIVVYPVCETIHKRNICDVVIVPAPVSKNIKKKTERLARKVMKSLKGAGAFGIEMFLTKKGNVLINEIAPRVHNSGHYTIEACITSQFEQHIRAVTGLPLGSTEMKVPAAVMINILGERTGPSKLKGLKKTLTIPQVFVHVYGKMETKIDRKMGHITALGKNIKDAYKKARLARKYISI